jgi:hypothetical protein
MSRDC